MNEAIADESTLPSTKALKAQCLRALLRWLEEAYDAPRLAQLIRKYPKARPRNITATFAEREALLENENPGYRLWLLLCSDLAIRSGTAARLGPQNWNDENETLTFTTKKSNRVTLPATQAIVALIRRCGQNSQESFTRQLWAGSGGKRNLGKTFDLGGAQRAEFNRQKKRKEIRRDLRPHDLRRTTAVAVLEATGDIRDVQAVLGHRALDSTLHYLDHDLRPVRRSLLETIKRPAWAERKEA